ncbi:MAG: TIGR00266 family protein [Candidatus Omnitrophica bacterium]|nr:hypothetical protein [bacterium]NUN97676.1 TIGR00266 family protein [Candidatus Omnitrophota bacterium]
MSKWYLSYNGQQVGPMDLERAIQEAAANPNGHAWCEGFPSWKPISEIPELQGRALATIPSPPKAPNQTADVIDYRIVGEEMQFVEIELDPGESAIAEAGAMMYKDSSVEMDSVFGDGTQTNASFFDKLVGAGKRLLTSESLFTTVFTHRGSGKAHVAFAAPYPGNIIPLSLPTVNGRIICQKDSFLCAARGVSIGIQFQRKILTGLFGGEGFIMQRLEGDGMVFMHAGGTVIERRLGPGELLHVDTGCVVAYEGGVEMDIQQAGNIKTMLFGGEGLFFAILRGPGRVWLQSLPFSRLAGRMLMAQRGGKEEGSVLGGLGRLMDGDNRF